MKTNHTFNIDVVFDDACHMWVAVCDALFVTAEAATFEELSSKVWDLVPDSIALNNLPINPKALSLNFEVTQDADHYLAAA